MNTDIQEATLIIFGFIIVGMFLSLVLDTRKLKKLFALKKNK